MISKAVYLEGIDFTIFRMIIYCVFLQSCFYFLRQAFTFFRQGCFLITFFQNTRQPYVKEDTAKKLGRNRELEEVVAIRPKERKTGNKYKPNDGLRTGRSKDRHCSLYPVHVLFYDCKSLIKGRTLPSFLTLVSFPYVKGFT